MSREYFGFFAAPLALCLLGAPALAQTETRYQSGLKAALNRGAANQHCYAQVFARHAVLVERANGTRGWFAASTPSYNADMRRSCGIDRLDLVRQNAARGISSRSTSASGHSTQGAYRAGYRAAVRQGHGNPDCYARVFTRYAYPIQTPAGETGKWYGYRTGPAFVSELRGTCGA